MNKKIIATVSAVLVCAVLLIISFLQDTSDVTGDISATAFVTAAMSTVPDTESTATEQAIAETASVETTAETTVVTTVETTFETANVTETVVTTTEYTPPEDPRAPLLQPPEMPENPTTFYDDAAFIGDSVSVMLSWYAANGELGSPLFLTRESYSMAHAAWGTMLVQYDGREMPPEDALSESGVNKVFIMLGMNDVAVYGIEKTIEHWNIVIPRIREKCPDIEIYIQSCTPIWTGGEVGALNNIHMDEFNLRLKELADEYGYPFVDIAPYMKDSTGGLASVYCSDGYVHLTNAGASAWVRVLLAYAESVEGKPDQK